MLDPKTRRLRDYKRCFYGCKFDEEPDLRLRIKEFLAKKGLELHPAVKPGPQVWPELALAMTRSAFCIFETATKSPTVHAALGFALARQLNVVVLAEKERPPLLPVHFGGVLRVEYERKNLPMLVAHLDKERTLPREWHAVEERLARRLRGATELERKLIELLALSVQPAAYFSTGALAGLARQALRENPEAALPDFLRRFDELLEYKDATGGTDSAGAATPTAFEGQEIRLDAEYRAFVAGELNLALPPQDRRQ